MNLRRAVLGTLLAVLAGCAAPPPLSMPDELAGAGTLARTGRFAVRVEPVGADPEAVQGGFAWYDSGTQVRLDLMTPVGTSLARVEIGPDGRAVLIESNGNRTEADSADALVERVLGTPIPVQELRYWLRGRLPSRPGSAVTVLEHDERQRPLSFVHTGWQVRVEAYDDLGPLRMQLHRAEPGVRTIEVRLSITRAIPS